jgi:carboxyl-terminal processing protease
MNRLNPSQQLYRFRQVGLLLISGGLTLLLAGWLSGCGALQQKAGPRTTQQQQQQAQALYQEVWQAVQESHLDPSFNHQPWQRWRYRYQGQLHTLADAQVAVASMLASLNDPYTRFLSGRPLHEQQLQIEAELSGVGIELSRRDGQLVIVAALEGTPAAKAHLQPNDQIRAVDEQSTIGLGLAEAAELIRGPKGSTVELTIWRQSHSQPFQVALKRDTIPIHSVFQEPLSQAPELGYIRVRSFLGETLPLEFLQALKQVQEKDGLIIDLRGNAGGLLTNALSIANAFLDHQLIVTVEGRSAFQQERLRAKAKQAYAGPLVLLIDQGSASASEIVAGALKDQRRAILVGERTFGKGLVQRVIPLEAGEAALNLTVARYKTPAGVDIHEKGIEPHLVVAFDVEQWLANPKQGDTQLQAAIAYLQQTQQAKPISAA